MKRRFVLVCGGGALVAAGLIIGPFLFTSRNLIQRSHVLAPADRWLFITGRDPYRWLDANTIFTIQSSPRRPILYKVNEHRTIYLESLRRLIGGNDRQLGIPGWDIAPDAKHIAWCKLNENLVHTAVLDGSEHRMFPLETGSSKIVVDDVTWLKDGHHWIAHGHTSTDDTAKYFVGDIASKQVSVVPVQEGKQDTIELADPVQFENEVATVQRHVGSASNAAVKREQVIAPSNEFLCEVGASPDRSHLLWHFERQEESRVDAFITRLFPNHVTQIRFRCSLWVSWFDGSMMKEVGHIDVITRYPKRTSPRQFVWMKDGKHISYLADDELYSIDVGEFVR